MVMSSRDRAVVELVAQFGQASAAHVAALLFDGLTPARPNHRLRRLTQLSYLARIERRLIGGVNGGSGQYVYCLGREGHRLYSDGKYYLPQIDEHKLAILSTYQELICKERSGRIQLTSVLTEPDCHVQVGRTLLKPDLAVQLTGSSGQQQPYMFEVERTVKSQRRIQEKFERYWSAYKQADAEHWPHWPLVVFMTFDAVKADNLKRLVAQLPAERRPLFAVATLETLRAAEL